jgi:hypothetical protein
MNGLAHQAITASRESRHRLRKGSENVEHVLKDWRSHVAGAKGVLPIHGRGGERNLPLPAEPSFLSLTRKNVVATAIKVSQEPWVPDALAVRTKG